MSYRPRTHSPTGLSKGQALFIFGGFLLAGLVGGYFLTYLPLAKVVAARGWEETPCVILTSKIEMSRDTRHRDQRTYGVEMTYSFDHGGREYVGSRYNFEIGKSSDPDRKEAILAKYPPGTKTTCFVDPDDPFQSVVSRSPGPYLLWGLLPLPFILGGLGGLLALGFFAD